MLEGQLVHLQSLNASLQQVMLGRNVSITMVMLLGGGESCRAGSETTTTVNRESEENGKRYVPSLCVIKVLFIKVYMQGCTGHTCTIYVSSNRFQLL